MTAQLSPIPLIGPGFLGLNKQQAASTGLGPEWALELQNAVFGSTGRITSRKGWDALTSSPLGGTPDLDVVHEYHAAGGTATEVISAANLNLYSGTSTLTSVLGAVTPTSDDWQFVNFYDRVIGAQTGETLISWNGGGNFGIVTGVGSIPNGNCVCAAFGRVWASNATGYTVQYSTLGVYNDFGGAGSGSIDMRTIWKNTDVIKGIYAFGPNLVVFGNKQIVLFADGSGSALGLDPANIFVSDLIEGTGLVARDSVQLLDDGDLIYLSQFGLQSLRRAIVQKNNPVSTITPQMQDDINQYVRLEDQNKIRSVFSPENKFYLLILPGSGRVFCVDTSKVLQDGSRRVTEWTGIAPTAAARRSNGDLIFGQAGVVGLYSGYDDNGGSYRLVYASPHLTGGPDFENRLKIGKELGAVIFTLGTTEVVYKWGYNFAGLLSTTSRQALGGAIPEYGTAEYGTNGVYDNTDPSLVAGTDYSEYGGAISLRVVNVPLSGDGRWLQLGLEVEITGAEFSIQQLDWYGKAGRVV